MGQQKSILRVTTIEHNTFNMVIYSGDYKLIVPYGCTGSDILRYAFTGEYFEFTHSCGVVSCVTKL